MNNEANKTVLKLIKNRQLSPEEGAKLIKALSATKSPAVQDIAVIGMSGIFPDAENIDEYWKNLAAGKDSVTEIPSNRLRTEQFYDPDPDAPNKSHSKWAGLLNDIDKFDPAFFKISPREAELMDPQQRLFLQEAWRALEDAGYSPDMLDGKKCGVFVGCSTGDYQFLFPENNIYPQPYSLLGNITSVLAARISYLLNLKGPSIAIDTACSSSLVALHLACESIRSGTSDMALAGGVMVYPTPYSFIWASKMGILSPEGKCKTFDHHADGIAIGECAAAVILKPLEAALEAGDHIIGIIKGSGINQDGNTDPGITAPSASSQAALEMEVYEKYKINPETISYVEAHGTGTKLGDPIEIDALTQAFSQYTQKKQYCAIGSVKTNIGHTQIAAGIAGFIKLLLCLQHKKLVPSLHLQKENEYLNFPATPFYVNTTLKDWQTLADYPRRAALSSFGFSGTNAHLVVEEYIPQSTTPEPIINQPHLIVLSAANPERLQAYAEKMLTYLNNAGDGLSLANFAYTLQIGRLAMNERLAIVADTVEQITEALSHYIAGNTKINGLYSGNLKKNKAELAQYDATALAHIHTQSIEEIAQLWVLGATVEWQKLYADTKPQRLSLPTYPFAKKSYWIPVHDSQPQPASPSTAVNATGQTATSSQTGKDHEILYYRNDWIAAPLSNLSEISNALPATATVLLFDLNESRYKKIQEKLKCKLILVTCGDTYQQHNAQHYVIRANQAADYQKLFTDLNSQPDYLLHLWSQAEFNSENLPEQLEKSLFSVFYLTQALIALKPKKTTTLLYTYLTHNDEIQPHYAAISGLIKSVRQEQTKLTYKTLALPNFDNIGKHALTEFSSPDLQIRYTNNQRWVQQLQPLPDLAQQPMTAQLPDKGVYLITGGLGGIGWVFAEYLARRQQATLILSGRSPLSAAQQTKIDILKQLGAEVRYQQADVANRAAVQTLIANIKAEFKTLNGIIHSAGVIQNALISQKTAEDINAIIAAKVYGTTYLDEATHYEPLDFFVLFSSVISLMDNVGQADYAYANAFIDHFAAQREQRRENYQRFGKTIAINWPLWQHGGMQVDAQTAQWIADAMGMEAISNQTGIDTFLRSLTLEAAQLIVIEGEPQKIRKALGTETTTAPTPDIETNSSTDKKVTPHDTETDLQNSLLRIVAENLKIEAETIDPNEDISVYGADSILAIMIVNQINQQYDLELSATLFFDYPTLNGLTTFLAQEYPQRFTSIPPTPQSNAALETSAINPATLQQALRDIVAENLKIDAAEIDIEEDINSYGADSILAIMIINQINQQYDLELSATLFFDYPTISGLVAFLSQEYPHRFAAQQSTEGQTTTNTTSANLPLIQLQQEITQIIASTLKIEAAEIDGSEDISTYGADSIMAIMIVNQINQQYDLELSATLFFDYPTVDELIAFLAQEHPERFGQPGQPGQPPLVDTATASPATPGVSPTQLQQTILTIVAETLKLQPSEIDLNEDISTYGADSIMAIMIINQINQQYDLELSATLFFDYPSIASLTQFLTQEYPQWFSDNESTEITENNAVTAESTTNVIPEQAESTPPEEDHIIAEYPLSYDQQAQWFMQQKDGEGTAISAYNLSISHRICSPLNVEALRQTFQLMVDRHPALRTVFAMQEGQLVQRVRARQNIAFKIIDATGWNEEFLRQQVIEADRKPFNLATGPLFRVHLFQCAADNHVLLITIHHIVFDGWSGAIVMDELSKSYPLIAAGKPPELPELPHTYQDYIQWHRDLLASPKADKQWQYWQQQLSGDLPVLQLRVDNPRPPILTHNGAIHFFQLDAQLIQQLKQTAVSEGTTLFSLLLAAFNVFLADETGQEEIIIGSPVANRNSHKLTGLVGDLVNMVAMRNRCTPDISFRTFLGQVKNTVQEALKNAEYPFQLLVKRLQPKRIPGYSPIFQAVFVLQKPLFRNSPWQTMDPTVDKFTWAGMDAEAFIIPTAAGRFDLQLEIVELENTLVSWFNYKSDLFNQETIERMTARFKAFLQAIVGDTQQSLNALHAALKPATEPADTTAPEQTIAISATFTAEPVQDGLDFWMQQLDIPAQISFAPYHQVFQQLLDPTSLLANNRQGLNVILIRFEDWLDRHSLKPNQEPSAKERAAIEKNTEELGMTLKNIAQNAAVPYLLCVCPPSSQANRYLDFFKQMETRLENSFKDSNGLYLVKCADLLNTYPVANYYDALGDKEGHVPYTPALFTALSTLISRKFYALKQKPYKAIVLDCDNTLWQGVCGEDGPQGITISAPFQALQKFMLEQQAAGVLLCLNSKNVEEDVFAVFDQRSDMLIKREHLVSWRINWQPKSTNMQSLAEELNLGLDSFIFIDDNPLECAEVRANCPEVLTLQIPKETNTIAQYLRHIWAFDRFKVTAEDKKRTAFYQQNVQREQLRQQTMTLDDFLASLQIQIDIKVMQPAQISRVSQMTQRTNQFNATTIRRSEPEIQQLAQSDDYTCLVVEVKDRFGDYGVVGLLIFTVLDDSLYVDTFLVSCRVLGRGVEHAMLAKMGEIALQRGLKAVAVGFQTTRKNKPMRRFLDSVAQQPLAEGDDRFWFTADYCRAIVYQPDKDANRDMQQETAQPKSNDSIIAANSNLLERIATQLSDPEQVLQLLEADKFDRRQQRQQAVVAPRNEIESKLVDLWRKVLHVQSVSIYDNFFEFGGDSLLAVKVMFYIQQDFGVELPLSVLLNAPTVAELATIINADSADATTITVNKQTVHSDNNNTIFPLSYGQQALWFLYQADPQSAAYNVALPLRIRSPLNLPVLQNAFQALMNRHPSLRTTFLSVDQAEPQQQVNQYQLIPFHWLDASDKSSTDIQTAVVQAYQQPFDLYNEPLLRVNVWTLNSEDHILLLTLHHIIVDGWSIWAMLEELSALYAQIKAGQQPQFVIPEYVYADFVAWQHQLLADKEETLWAYWHQQLGDELPILNLPTDFPRPSVQHYQGASLHFTVPQALLNRLKQLAQQEQVTLYTVLLAAYQVLLFRYSGQSDILIGTPTSGRTQKAFSDIVGYFVNMVVLRTPLDEHHSFKAFLPAVQKTLIGALEHQDYPFMRLVKRLQPHRDASRTSLFQVDFAFQQLQPGEHLTFSGSNEAKLRITTPELALETFEMGQQEGLFDLSLDILEVKESLVATFMYRTDLFKASTIARMAEHFQILLEGISRDASLPITQLPLLSEAERRQLLFEWNSRRIHYPVERCLPQLFEQQAARTPEAVAVTASQGASLTYAELNRQANQLAHHLRSLGVKPDTVVGICVERSVEMVVGLLAILKAGGAYLPLDPEHPSERIAFMLDDAGVRLLLTQSHLREQFAALSVTMLNLDTAAGQCAAFSEDNPVCQISGENLAYIIYTSGSTGAPKGVLLQHAGLRNHNQAMIEQYQLSSADNCLQFAHLNFDVAGEEIFPTLLSGANLVLSPKNGFASFEAFQAFITAHQLTVLNLPASYWHEWVAFLTERVPAELRLVVVGSEKVSLASLQAWQKLAGHEAVQWFNAYGPTEATITATLYQPDNAQLAEQSVSSVLIGRPIANMKAYVLDKHLQPVPVGVPGELHLSGIGLAQGYLNHPALTAEKFVANPFADEPVYARLYKTGDLVRYCADGNIAYIERLDHQVKLRGFRIEIGEIEATLLQQPQVQDALVKLFDNKGSQYLGAYVVPTDSALLHDEAWQARLADDLNSKLPDYMVPTTFVHLSSMPLTPNGKINRQALPEPDLRQNTGYVAPGSELEQQLAQIWGEVLKHDIIGIHDNFFELGGDSIRSLQIVAKAKEYDLFIKTNDIFQYQTIAKLAPAVQQDKRVEVDQGLVSGDVPLLPVQQAFFARHLPEPWHYNQYTWLEATSDLDVDHLRQALAAVLRHHDALRLRYHPQGAIWQQSYAAPSADIPLYVEDVTHIAQHELKPYIDAKAHLYQASLNLDGHLTALVVFQGGDNSRLLWCIHHLVVDGVAWRILLTDLHRAYQQIQRGETVQLPPKTSAFKTWAEQLVRYAYSEELAVQAAYWQAMLAQPFTLPTDATDANSLASSQEYVVQLDAAATRALLQEASGAYQTRINDLLLTALAQTLSAWSGQRECVIELESHGRSDLFDTVDISRTVGWFTAIYPLQLRLPPDDADLAACIQAVKSQLNQVPDEGIGYGILRYLKQSRALANEAVLGQVLFNYLGQFDDDFSEQGGAFRVASGAEAFGLSQSRQGERDYVLEINSAVRDGCLLVSWSYSGNRHHAATIQHWANYYLEALQAISQHCQQVAPQDRSDPAELLVPIREEGTRAPFFCLPGLQGVPRYLYPLAYQLPAYQPFYALQAPELVEQPSSSSLEKLASRYIAALKTVQPQGPYQLGGHSFGATVAFEMVRQLENANEEVSVLVLLDEPAPTASQERVELSELEELVAYLRWLAYFNDIAEYQGDLTDYSPDERLAIAVNYLNQAGLALDQQALQTTLRAFTNNNHCYNHYVPQSKIDSRMVLVHSQQQETEQTTPGLGWQAYTSKTVEVYQVTGGHFSMLTPPHVSSTAKVMMDILEQKTLI